MLKNTLFKYPSAWVPIVLSCAMLAFICWHLSTFGIVYQEDEGVAAHLFQLWLVVEMVSITFFAIKRLPQAPSQTLAVLAVQMAAVVVAASPIFLLGL